MRYLWVEDFNDDSESRHVNQRLWESCFQLEEKICRIFGTLEEALLFLEEPENWRCFDAVLIDIRFPVSHGSPEDVIYEKYFGSFLKKEQFRKYAGQTNRDPSSAAAGVLLFLALVHRYHYSQSRIAFISANVDGSGEKLTCLKRMREVLCKACYEPLTEGDIDDFSEANTELAERYEEVRTALRRAEPGGYSAMSESLFEEIPEDMDFPTTSEIGFPRADQTGYSESDEKDVSIQSGMEISEVKRHLTKLDRIEKLLLPPLSDGGRQDLKYDSVKAEFGRVGLLMPQAFEKPGKSGEISWQFRIWSDHELGTEYNRLRSRIIPICLTIEGAVKQGGNRNGNQIVRPYIDMVSQTLTPVLLKTPEKELLFLLEDMMELLPGSLWIDRSEKYVFIYNRALRACVSLCEKMGDKNGYKNSYKAVLKIARNWLAHQGIRDVGAFDVMFLFHLMTHAFFDMTGNAVYTKLDDALVKEFCGRDRLSRNSDRKTLLAKCRAAADKKHQNAFDKFANTSPEIKPAQRETVRQKGYEKNGRIVYCYRPNAPLFDVISSLGNEYSPVRETVSMRELYLLFLENMGKDGDKWETELEEELLWRMTGYAEEA